LAQEAIRTIVEDDQADAITMNNIKRIVAAQYQLSVEELVSKKNSKQLAIPRQIAMYL